jgi:hypothetical protein
MTENLTSLAGLTLVFCFAGFVKGVIGMGCRPSRWDFSPC